MRLNRSARRLAGAALLALLAGCHLTVEPLDEAVPRFVTGTGRERQYRSYPSAPAAARAALGPYAVIVQRWRIQNDAEFVAAAAATRPAALELLCRLGMDGRWFVAAARPVPDTAAARTPEQFPEIDRLALAAPVWDGTAKPQALPDDARWRQAADLVARWCAALPRGEAAALVSPDCYRTTYYRFHSPAARRTLTGAVPGNAAGVNADGMLLFTATAHRAWAGIAFAQPLLLQVGFDGDIPVIAAVAAGPPQEARA